MDPIQIVLLELKSKTRNLKVGGSPPRNKSGGPRPMRPPRFRHLWLHQCPQHLRNKKHLATHVRFCCWLFSLQL